jgi:hypothetical protein
MIKILPTILLVLVSTSVFATHLMGGEITAKQTAVLQYEVNMVLYRDTDGISMDQDQSFSIFNEWGQLVASYDFDYQASISGSQVVGFPYGVQPYYFQLEITLPSSGKYLISWADCCRNEAIINLSYPLNDNMYLSTELTVYSSFHNSTPEFLSPPVVYLPAYTHWQYNPLPVDTDGDSLHWEIDEVYRNMDGISSDNWVYPCNGWVTPASVLSFNFRIDEETGVISWMASTLGNFVASILVTEYRDGEEIGQVRRDMQFVVVPKGSNEPPTITLHDPEFNVNGNPQYNMVPWETLKIQLTGADEENSNDLEIYAYSETFADSGLTANFITSQNGDEQEGIFTLKADSTFGLGESRLVNFRVTDGIWNYDVTVVIKMFGTYVPVLEEAVGFLVYPNPTEGQFKIWLDGPVSGPVKFEVRDLAGKLVGIRNDLQVFVGENYWEFDFDLITGLYLVYITDQRGIVSSQKLVVR